MSNQNYQKNKRRLVSLSNKKVKRTRIQKHKRYITSLNKTHPKCETCGTRNKAGFKCANCFPYVEVVGS